jgi:hypothetical protein
MQLKVWLQSPQKPSQMVIFNTNTTIQGLKEKAAEIFKFESIDNLQVTIGQNERELKDDDKTLAECKITDEAHITIKKREREHLQIEVISFILIFFQAQTPFPIKQMILRWLSSLSLLSLFLLIGRHPHSISFT